MGETLKQKVEVIRKDRERIPYPQRPTENAIIGAVDQNTEGLSGLVKACNVERVRVDTLESLIREMADQYPEEDEPDVSDQADEIPLVKGQMWEGEGEGEGEGGVRRMIIEVRPDRDTPICCLRTNQAQTAYNVTEDHFRRFAGHCILREPGATTEPEKPEPPEGAIPCPHCGSEGPFWTVEDAAPTNMETRRSHIVCTNCGGRSGPFINMVGLIDDLTAGRLVRDVVTPTDEELEAVRRVVAHIMGNSHADYHKERDVLLDLLARRDAQQPAQPEKLEWDQIQGNALRKASGLLKEDGKPVYADALDAILARGTPEETEERP